MAENGSKFWSVNRLHDETGLDRRTIKKRLSGVVPVQSNGGGEHLYDGPTAFRALFPTESKEIKNIVESEARKMEAEAGLKELQLARERREMLASEDVLRVWADIAVAIRQIIKGSSLSDSEKNECLRQIRELSVDDFGKEKASE